LTVLRTSASRFEVADGDVLQERDGERALVGSLGGGPFEKPEKLALRRLLDLPGLGVAEFPAVGAFFKVLTDEDEEILVAEKGKAAGG